jgi:hypothetical protein
VPQPKGKKAEAQPSDQRSRRARIEADKGEDARELIMPPLDPGDDEIIALLFAAGPCKSGFSGPTGLEWADLAAYDRLARAYLSPGESELLRGLSAVYASAARDASEPDAISDWLEEDLEHKTEQVETAEKGLALILRSMSAKP